jgi:hypothetical protein
MKDFPMLLLGAAIMFCRALLQRLNQLVCQPANHELRH